MFHEAQCIDVNIYQRFQPHWTSRPTLRLQPARHANLQCFAAAGHGHLRTRARQHVGDAGRFNLLGVFSDGYLAAAVDSEDARGLTKDP